MSGLDARGFRVATPALPELVDEQAELLAFWLRERGYRVAGGDGDESVELPGVADVARQDRIRHEALRFAMDSVYELVPSAADIVAVAEAFRKFLMGDGDGHV